MAKQFHYEDLSCFALQQAIKTNGSFEVVLSGEHALAFEKIARSLSTTQKMDQEPFAIFKNQIRVWEITFGLFRNIRLAWNTMLKYHRFNEFRTFWHIEKPISVSVSAQTGDETVFEVSRLTIHSSRDARKAGAP